MPELAIGSSPEALHEHQNEIWEGTPQCIF